MSSEENVSLTPAIGIQCWGKGVDNLLGFATTQFKNPLTGSSDWEQVKVKFKVPKGTVAMYVRAVLTAPANAGGRVWFDDISITRM
jgi:hypothetical protein